MIARVMVLVCLVAVIILGIGAYLAPDDLANCTISQPAESGACAAADAIVVVSGGDTIARTDEAIRLFRAGWAPRIVFSGAAADKSGPSNAQVMRQHAIDRGVPIEATIVEEESETTKQNAEQVRQYIMSDEIQDIILVTSGYHMRRASLEFASQLPDILVRRHPADYDSQWNDWWWLTPDGWYMATSELAKIIAFYTGSSR